MIVHLTEKANILYIPLQKTDARILQRIQRGSMSGNLKWMEKCFLLGKLPNDVTFFSWMTQD